MHFLFPTSNVFCVFQNGGASPSSPAVVDEDDDDDHLMPSRERRLPSPGAESNFQLRVREKRE